VKSGIGLPHSKTLARGPERGHIRKVLECGSRMPEKTVEIETVNHVSVTGNHLAEARC